VPFRTFSPLDVPSRFRSEFPLTLTCINSKELPKTDAA